MAKHLVRVTQEPGVVREIDDAELLDLARQGILHSYEHTDEASAVLGGTVKTNGKWADKKRDEDLVTAPDPATDPASNAADKKKGA